MLIGGEGIYAEILHLSETWENLTREGEKNKRKEKKDKYDDTLMKKSTSKQKKKRKKKVRIIKNSSQKSITKSQQPHSKVSKRHEQAVLKRGKQNAWDM